MLPKEDCVLSIRFFFGGVLGGGLMVTMLPRGARRRGGGLGGSDVGSPRRLPGSLAAGADRLHRTTIHQPSAANASPRRRALLCQVCCLGSANPNPRPAGDLCSARDVPASARRPVQNTTAGRDGRGLALAITRRVVREEGDLGLPCGARRAQREPRTPPQRRRTWSATGGTAPAPYQGEALPPARRRRETRHITNGQPRPPAGGLNINAPARSGQARGGDHAARACRRENELLKGRLEKSERDTHEFVAFFQREVGGKDTLLKKAQKRVEELELLREKENKEHDKKFRERGGSSRRS